MKIENKYSEVRELVIKNIQNVILAPVFFTKQYRTETNYLDKLNNVFVGGRTMTGNGDKYSILIYLQDFKTKQWIREVLHVDNRFNVTRTILTEGIV